MTKFGTTTKVGIATLIGGITAIAMATPASAAPPTLTVKKTVATGFVGPLQFAVSGSDVYVADSFTASLSKVSASGTTVIAHASPTNGGDSVDIAGVAVDTRRGNVAYTSSSSVGDEGEHTAASLTILQPGHAPVVADLLAFEKAKNPDKVIPYGVVGTPSKCVTDALTKAGIPISYTGEVDSHPYAVAALSDGSFAVADAGGNDIVKVDRKGNVSQIRVMPAQQLKITQALADEESLPSCVVGITYRFEAVPTDVEVGPNGTLYVSTLPGGPEGPNAGNRGAVYTIDQQQRITKIADGLGGATNVAVDPHGTVYVAELSSGQISQIVNGKPVPVFKDLGVVGVEYTDGKIYASTAPAVFADPSSTTPPAPGEILLLG